MHLNLNTGIDRYHKFDLEFLEARLPVRRSDTTLLMGHGINHDGDFYIEQMQQITLNDAIRCLSVSYEGHGGSPLQEKSINDLSTANYKEDILAAIRVAETDSKIVIPILHSMGAFCGAELLAEKRLPDSVKAMVWINPVTLDGVWKSALSATIKDWRTFNRFTPGAFAKDLLLKNLEHFMKSNPERFASLFFSSDPGMPSRIVNDITPQEFCNNFLNGESSKVMWEIMCGSKLKPVENSIPVLVVNSLNDRVISIKSGQKAVTSMKNANHHAVELKTYTSVSHETPMDIDGTKVFEDIVNWLRKKSLV